MKRPVKPLEHEIELQTSQGRSESVRLNERDDELANEEILIEGFYKQGCSL